MPRRRTRRRQRAGLPPPASARAAVGRALRYWRLMAETLYGEDEAERAATEIRALAERLAEVYDEYERGRAAWR